MSWSVDGDLMGWDYNILNFRGVVVARVNKVIFNHSGYNSSLLAAVTL